jgi:hypothetical protein
LALFSARPFTAAQDRRGRPITHEVLESEASDDARPSVVVLHELPGLSLEALRFGRCLVDAGFRVHLPLLYGEPGRGSMVGGTRDALWCLRHELDLFTRGAASPLVDWVRALVRDVASSGPVRVGIVGMCMTGGIAVAALAEGATGCRGRLPAVAARAASLPLAARTRRSGHRRTHPRGRRRLAGPAAGAALRPRCHLGGGAVRDPARTLHRRLTARADRAGTGRPCPGVGAASSGDRPGQPPRRPDPPSQRARHPGDDPLPGRAPRGGW